MQKLALLMLLLLYVHPGHATEVSAGKQLEGYIKLAVRVYQPQLEITSADRQDMRKRHDRYWLSQRAVSRDFLFIKRNSSFPFVITELNVDGKTASAVVVFTPDTGSLTADAPMYFATRGRYELSRRGGLWKLAGFREILPKQKYPVEAGTQPEKVLTHYFELSAMVYPVRKSDELPRKQQIAAVTKMRALWKPDKVDPATMTIGKSSPFFFKIYQPSDWKIQKVRKAGDYARAYVQMTVGSPLQIKLRKGVFTRQVQYSLIRKAGNWYIATFEDLDAAAEREKRREEKTLAELEKKRLAVSRPDSGSEGKKVLVAYFRQLQRYYYSKTSDLSDNPLAVVGETKKFWKLNTRNARSAHARSMSFFRIFRPSAWNIEVASNNGDTATAHVAFTIGNQDMLKLSRGNPTKTVLYALMREGRDWFLVGFKPVDTDTALNRTRVGTRSKTNPTVSAIKARGLREGTISYMDKLRSCTPHTFSYPHPFLKGFTGKNIIKGMRDDQCIVDYVMPNNMLMHCAYSAETIAMLTSEQKYREARTGRFSGSTSSRESKAMTKECVTTKRGS
ncbi:MAG TPA: hypothetical protein ENI62_10150 [Gammaproteobacteria bacterium]|nr:hypothetical protein [Gammaproteobacteria bacterium]